jgi:hypothetical protein
VTLGIFVALRAAIGVYLRPHYMAPITKLFPPVGPDTSPPGAWILSTNYVNAHGVNLGAGFPTAELPSQCRTQLVKGVEVKGQCLTSNGFHQLVTYQPASRFWAFQGIEAALFLVLAAALVGFAWWYVLTRDA